MNKNSVRNLISLTIGLVFCVLGARQAVPASCLYMANVNSKTVARNVADVSTSPFAGGLNASGEPGAVGLLISGGLVGCGLLRLRRFRC